MKITPTMYQLGDGHSRYLISCESDNCMDVFKHPQLPTLGQVWHGMVVEEMRATKLFANMFLVELNITAANDGEPVPCS